MATIAAPTAPPMIGLDDIRGAAERLAPWIHRTPVMTSRTLDERSGGSVFLKCENFQKVGAFKIRGATNALLCLGDDEKARGVVTHSSGNHAQALAQAGRWLGVPVTVVMPRTAPAIKRAATEGYGATVVPCEPTLAARESTVADLVARHGYTLVHPFDDWRVIEGQGTAALELLDQAGPLGLEPAPLRRGGLLAGPALGGEGLSPLTRGVGADRPFSVIRRHVDAIVTATEPEILDAMRFVWERFKMIIEPSCAVPVAPVLNRQMPVDGLRVGIIITGGNVDLGPMFEALAEE